MDIQAIVEQVASKVQQNPDLLKGIAQNPQEALNGLTPEGVDIPADQVGGIVALLQEQLGKVDVGDALSAVDLSDGLGMDDVNGVIGKLFGK